MPPVKGEDVQLLSPPFSPVVSFIWCSRPLPSLDCKQHIPIQGTWPFFHLAQPSACFDPHLFCWLCISPLADRSDAQGFCCPAHRTCPQRRPLTEAMLCASQVVSPIGATTSSVYVRRCPYGVGVTIRNQPENRRLPISIPLGTHRDTSQRTCTV